MITLLNSAQLILYIGLLALVGQGVLHVLAGQKRDGNLFYQLFQVINRPWLGLARRIAPARVLARHHGWLAFLITAVFYLAVTLAKIEHCMSAAMVGCR